MSRRKRKWKLKYLAAAVATGALAALLFLNRDSPTGPAPSFSPQKQQTGYKMEDRLKLEQLIHEGTRHD